MIMDTRLFTTEQVTKFFNILGQLERGVNPKKNIYKGYNPLNPDIQYCQRQVFVLRTVNRWLRGKKVVLYKVAENSSLQYKQYIVINRIEFGLGYSDDLRVYFNDYSHPMNFFNSMIIDHNEVLRLEGEWDGSKHKAILDLFVLDIPQKEFVFKAFDFAKMKTRGKTKEEVMAEIETTCVIKAQTHYQAYKLKNKKDNELGRDMYISELIEVKEITDEKETN